VKSLCRFTLGRYCMLGTPNPLSHVAASFVYAPRRPWLERNRVALSPPHRKPPRPCLPTHVESIDNLSSIPIATDELGNVDIHDACYKATTLNGEHPLTLRAQPRRRAGTSTTKPRPRFLRTYTSTPNRQSGRDTTRVFRPVVSLGILHDGTRFALTTGIAEYV